MVSLSWWNWSWIALGVIVATKPWRWRWGSPVIFLLMRHYVVNAQERMSQRMILGWWLRMALLIGIINAMGFDNIFYTGGLISLFAIANWMIQRKVFAEGIGQFPPERNIDYETEAYGVLVITNVLVWSVIGLFVEMNAVNNGVVH